MTRNQLFDQIKQKESFLCVGLDTDPDKIPNHLKDFQDPIFEFNRQIIDATHQYAVAYKPNVAFYEALGSRGWDALSKTLDYIPEGILKIADAKRSDVGNTTKMYAKAFFENLSADALTVSPYMGEDSVAPYLEYSRKWAIVLAATSNPGALDFQDLMIENRSEKLFETVIQKTSQWGNANNLMYVVGATRPETLIKVRTLIPDHFLLIPGVGAQGGDLEAVCRYGMNKQVGLLINSSRGIIYAGSGEDFAEKAGEVARTIQIQMAGVLKDAL